METKQERCRHQRTKQIHVPDFSDPGTSESGESTTQHYWCLCTMTTRGTKCTSARIVLGAAAPVPWRAKAGENVLKNQVITVDLAKKAAREVLQAAIPLSGNAYKISVFKAVIYRTICWAGGVDPFA